MLHVEEAVNVQVVMVQEKGNSLMMHIGQLIRMELEAQERTPTWLARKINCDRTNIYRIFNRESIDTALLARISTALNRNFFEELSLQYVESSDKHTTDA